MIGRFALFTGAVLFCGMALADPPVYIFDPLPTPLILPAGNIETLPLNHQASFFGDAPKIVDCSSTVPVAFAGDTIAKEVEYGTCGNELFGGALLLDSHLTGTLKIQFTPTSPTTAHFVVTQGLILGDDSIVSAPLGYTFPVRNNQVSDGTVLSSGDLDLTTGYANPNTLVWNANFLNTALIALANVNPNLTAPTISFPGVRGFAWARFSQRSDGKLDISFRGSTFLPLGDNTFGQSVRWPLPYCDPDLNCASVLARGTTLHPHLYLDTSTSLNFTPCAPNCPDIPVNKTEVFTANSGFTAFGDDFELDIPQLNCPPNSNSNTSSACALNGIANGRAELQGRFEIQFGTPSGGTQPFKISAMVPEGLFAEPPSSPLLGTGFRGLLLGANQRLAFPEATYVQHRILFADEVFNWAQGMIDLASGQVIGEFTYPIYIGQELIDAIFGDNNGRVSADPFFAMALKSPQDSSDPNYAFFEKEPNGQTMFRANLFHHRSFATYCYPISSYGPGVCYTAGPSGNLNIFVKIQAAHLADPANPGIAVLSDSRSFTSSAGDPITYSFSAPCMPSGQTAGQATFVYHNDNSATSAGGVFTMKHLASVSCTNSKISTLPAGSYDQIAITGFGQWSSDPPNAQPRFMSASLSVNPAYPFATIIVYQRYPGESLTLQNAVVLPGDDIDVYLSTAENKPANKPTP
jgi:hypothetical protein